MTSNEQEIRDLVSTWLAASKSGDVEKVLSLMTDDVVFLVAGQPPMGKGEFEAASRAQAGPGGPDIDGRSDIREIRVVGDHAYMWQALTVTVTPPGATPARRAGHTLTIFRRENGRGRLARDANLLSPVK